MGINRELAKKLSRTEKAIDSAKLNGASESTLPDANKIVKRDTMGDVRARLFRSVFPSQPTPPRSTASIVFRNAEDESDSYLRFMTKSALKAWLALTKSDVGLNLVVNASQTSSVSDSSTTKYAVAKGVKTAYDKAIEAVELAASKITKNEGDQFWLGKLSKADDSRKLDGNSLSRLTYLQSFSDFTKGTLIKTDIPAASETGLSFVLDIEGKSYSNVEAPYKVTAQGYLYNNTIMNCTALSLGGKFSDRLTMLKGSDGALWLWFPRLGYWQSFSVMIWAASSQHKRINRAVSITDEAKPTSTKLVEVGVQRAYTTRNPPLPIEIGAVPASDMEHVGKCATANGSNEAAAGSDGYRMAMWKDVQDTFSLFSINSNKTTLTVKHDGYYKIIMSVARRRHATGSSTQYGKLLINGIQHTKVQADSNNYDAPEIKVYAYVLLRKGDTIQYSTLGSTLAPSGGFMIEYARKA